MPPHSALYASSSLSSGVSVRNRHGSPQRAALIFGPSGGGPATADPAVAPADPAAAAAADPAAALPPPALPATGAAADPDTAAAGCLSSPPLQAASRRSPARASVDRVIARAVYQRRSLLRMSREDVGDAQREPPRRREVQELV